MTGLVHILPIFDDNYVFCIRGPNSSSDVIIVDPGESEKCLDFINDNKLNLVAILITHHHSDHIDGAKELKRHFSNAKIYAPLKNKNQISFADFYLQNQDQININHFIFKVFELPGHTLGHLAYYESKMHWLFSGDVLFGLGCGRLFEGTPDMMMQSLNLIKSFNDETQIYCTHEYTMTNLKFADYLEESQKLPAALNIEDLELYRKCVIELRLNQKSTVPLSLGLQKKINPFLVSNEINEWTHFRELRNKFKVTV